MAFTSSILMENNSAIQSKNAKSIYELSNNYDDSYLYNLLEFNDRLHSIDIMDKCNYYRMLKESIIAENNNESYINEGIVSTINDRIIEFLQAIIDYLKRFVRILFHNDQKAKANQDKVLKELSKYPDRPPAPSKNTSDEEKSKSHEWYSNPEMEFEFTVYHFPRINKIDNSKIKSCLDRLNNELGSVCKGNPNAGNISEAILEESYRDLANAIKRSIDSTNSNSYTGTINNRSSFMEFVKTEVIYKTTEKLNYKKWFDEMMRSKLADKNEYSRRIDELKQSIENAIKLVNSSNITTEDQKKNANTLVNYIRMIVDAYTAFINMIHETSIQNYDYYAKYFNKVFNGIEMAPHKESGMIHGEKFDSDTLFDNEDYRDFNRTEWLDLNLTTECFELKYELLEAKKRIALQEALILTDDKSCKFKRLVAMREAEEQKTQSNVKGILERIKGFLDKFIKNINEKYAKNSKVIQRNMSFINQPVIIKNVTSSGDILAGMYRIQQRINIKPFNYETMKDDLKDKNTFFKNHVLPSLKNTSQYSKRRLEWTDDMSITEYCKAYYGASMKEPKDKYPPCVFDSSDIQSNLQNMVKFLNQTNNIFSAKVDLSNLEAEAKKITSKVTTGATSNSSTTTANNNAENNNSTGNQQKATTESMYYSELYNAWFTEAEIEMDQAKQQEENKENGNTGNTEESAAFKNYMECYKDVMTSKLTASEFIVSELMQIVQAHAQSHMNASQKKAEADQAAKEQPAPSTNQNNNNG